MIGKNFPKEHIIGTNNFSHLFIIICFFILSIVLSYKLSKKEERIINRYLIISTIYLVITEIVKMTYRFIKVGTFSHVFPMPFCFLCIPALIMYFINNDKIKYIARVFLCSGSLMGGSLYIFIPNGSIDKYPLYHVNSIHGLSFHFIMVVIGLTLLFKRMYVPKLKDFKYYFMFMGTFSVIALICNYYSGGNALFFGNDSGIPFLKEVIEKSHLLHVIIVFLGESILLFFIFYAIYSLIMNIRIKYLIKKEELQKS